MANAILTPSATHQSHPQYRLAEHARQAILMQAPAFQRRENVEQMRQEFIQKYGCDGTAISS